MRKRLKNLIVGVAIGVSLLTPFGAFTVSATDTTTEATTESSGGSGGSGKMYDGKPLDNPVCDSGFTNGFEGASYYDMAIPYALTNEEIGGYADGTNGGHSMADADRKMKVGSRWNIEGCHTATVNGTTILYSSVYNCSNIKIEHKDGFCVATDTSGTEYLLLALPKFFYNTDKALEWSTTNRGQIIEIYFTDGKYIRGIVGDCKAEVHTNGGKDGQGGVGTSNPNDADDTYSFAKLNYPQYANIYQAYAGEVFEWFRSDASFSNVAEIAGSSGSVAFVRMYDKKITEGVPTLASGMDKSYKGTRENKGCNIGSDTQGQADGASGYAGGTFQEMDYATYSILCEADLSGLLDDANRDNLTNDELTALQNWEDNTTEVAWYITVGRRLTLLIGILIILWGVLFYLGYWFDKINVFFNLDMVGILSMKRLAVSDNEDECTFTLSDLQKTEKRTINHKYALFISLCSIVFGVLIVSGFIFTLIRWIVNKFKGLLF